MKKLLNNHMKLKNFNIKNAFKKHNKKKLSAIALISIIFFHLIYQSINAYKVSLDSLGEDIVIVNVNRASPFDKFFNRDTFKTKRLAQDKEAFKIANNYCNFKEDHDIYLFIGKKDQNKPSFVDGPEYRGKGNHLYDQEASLYKWKFRFFCSPNLENALSKFSKNIPKNFKTTIDGPPVSFYFKSMNQQTLLPKEKKEFLKEKKKSTVKKETVEEKNDVENDYKWEISTMNEGQTVLARMNGNVVYGDTLMFSLRNNQGKCDILQESFMFYTMSKNPDIKKIEGKIIPIKSSEGNTYAEASYVLPFMMGNRVMFSMGSYKVDEHIDFLSKYKTYDVTIVDETNPKSAEQSNMIENFKAADYFDVPNNSWNVKNAKEAILKAQKLCLEYKVTKKNITENNQVTKTYADGSKYVGETKDGTPHGQGTYTSSDGFSNVKLSTSKQHANPSLNKVRAPLSCPYCVNLMILTVARCARLRDLRF